MRRSRWATPTRMWVWDDRGRRVTARPDVAWSRLSPERRRAARAAARSDPLLGVRVWHLGMLAALAAPVVLGWWLLAPLLLIGGPI